MEPEFLVFSGNSHVSLAQDICSHLSIPLGKALIGRFADGETRVEIQTCVRGKEVFVLQPSSQPANESIMELLIIVDALRRASAGPITAVLPFYGYSRQERKTAPRTPITAKLVAHLLEAAGVNRILTLDLHSGAIQGFFQIPVDHLTALPVFLNYFQEKSHNFHETVVVSPDAGGVERARSFAKSLGCGLAIVDKRRDGPGVSQVMHIIGDVQGKKALLIDDICDTGGSLIQAAEGLLNAGANSIQAVVTHGVFSANAIDKIENSCLESLIVTNTIPQSPKALQSKKIAVLSISPLIAKAMSMIFKKDSVSTLFL